ncbi:MAG: DUF4145 domain-containing protein [Gemmatimonadetes bacterium]|nr:DUF4145 domain-containing protein [Gemmatimonadota bacterium]
MTEPFSFVCDFCGQPTTITEPNYSSGNIDFSTKKSEHEWCGFSYDAVACPNPKCKKLTFKISFVKYGMYRGEFQPVETIQKWDLLPESSAKPQPNYIPKAIRDDYYEACRIRDLSAKASATLARRCLQGMIHDFWSIEKPTLKKEIDALQSEVDVPTWNAIEAVRKVGNIGAHMEKDVNLIIDVEPREAQLLIGLIETLLKEWYVAKHDREEHFKKLEALAQKIATAKKAGKGKGAKVAPAAKI